MAATPAIADGLKNAIFNECFAADPKFLDKIAQYDGSPNGVLTAAFKNQICYDYTNTDWYINCVNSTTWYKMNY